MHTMPMVWLLCRVCGGSGGLQGVDVVEGRAHRLLSLWWELTTTAKVVICTVLLLWLSEEVCAAENYDLGRSGGCHGTL